MPHQHRSPIVSIVVPFLDAERFLAEAIDSALAQTFSAWEMFLVDDGSSDGSTELARAYAARDPARIRYLEHPGHANRGISASRNLGIAHSAGRYLAPLDSDDVWLPEKLEQQVTLAEAHPYVSLVYGLSMYWYGWTGRREDVDRDFLPDLGIPGDRVYGPRALSPLVYPLGTGTAPPPSDWLIRREALLAVNGFEEQFTGLYGLYEDHAFLAKMYLRGSVLVSSNVWEKYRVRPDSYMASSKAAGRYASARSFFLSWLERYLDANAIRDPAVWDALRRASAEGPVLHDVARVGKWTLRRHNGSAANLTTNAELDLVRLEIKSVPSRVPYDLQLNLPHLAVEADRRYVVRFQARADERRPLSFGFAEAHSPWENLGLYREVEVTPDWQEFEGPFSPPVTDRNGRIHFDVGQSDVAFELKGIRLLHLHSGAPYGEVVEPTAHLPAALTAGGHAKGPSDAPPRLGEVQFGSFRRLTPISGDWGWDRGQPIDRYFIERFLNGHAGYIRGRVLEIGGDTYTRQFGERRVTASDVLHIHEGAPGATLVGDLADAPHIPSDAFDCVILTQTLQLIYDVRGALRTVQRILRPGGALLLTVPGISQTYDKEWSDTWYWGFTPHSVRRLLESAFGAGQSTVDPFGNVLASVAFLHGLSAQELTEAELDFRGRGYAVTITALALKPSTSLS